MSPKSIQKPKLLTIPQKRGEEDFPLVDSQKAAPIYWDSKDFRVVQIAAEALAADIERVTKTRPNVTTEAPTHVERAIFIGTLGQSSLIDELIAAKKLDVSDLSGAWESFVIATVQDPFPGVKQALVIAGSDRRGTAYGVFSLSEAMGVSPWYWWADVPVRHHEALFVPSGAYWQGPPSVKYRGIFINDEDWGILPWSAKTFEPESVEGMGPKTYAKIFELLLRLKANYLWPAMHEVTKAFNLYPQNKVVADEYAVVMGSSHCEQMLRTNTTEWPQDRHKDWNPVTNLGEILEYWEQRVRENGRYESTWTVGMRGIHDSGMPGVAGIDAKREWLEKIIGLQRELLARHINHEASLVPQIFCAYKEVLDIYQSGMELPDDITMVWANDNHGYIRQLPNQQERQRSGGHGIYYHLSYWGRPHDYLWLESTSPALVWHEMTKAYDFGVRDLWVANVGDIKPTESGMTLFLQMAWDIESYGPDVQQAFLRDFYTQQFGEAYGEQIAALKDEYFRLCAIRRPEHMGFNHVYYSREVPNQPIQNSDWSHAPNNDEAGHHLKRWLELARRTEAFAAELSPEARDAYFQLVEYPACAAAAMAEKIITAEQARLAGGSPELAERSRAALERIEQLTERYNAQNGGKWRGMMNHQPRALPVFDLPPTSPQELAPTPFAPERDGRTLEIDATQFTQTHDRDGIGWRVIDGLGRRSAALTVFPRQDSPTRRLPQEIRQNAPYAEYTIEMDGGDEIEITAEALPTHRFTPAHEILAAVSLNDGEPVIVHFQQGKDDEHDPTWQNNVLRGAMFGQVVLPVPTGTSTLKLWAADAGVVVQRILLTHLSG